jgi:hypothetical protein
MGGVPSQSLKLIGPVPDYSADDEDRRRNQKNYRPRVDHQENLSLLTAMPRPSAMMWFHATPK